MAFTDFSEIRKSRGNGISNLLKEVEKLSSTGGGSQKDDDRFWQPELDKLGNGSATIRFLPAAPNNDYPWIRVYNHGFKNDANGKWFIENCPTTLGRDDCPLCKSNSELWNTGIKENQEIVRKRKRHLQYMANVMIIKDPKHPENEGQVKIFKFGKKIFDKIKEAMDPRFEDDTPIDPFDFWEGANFKLKIVKVDGFRNYDRSEFDSVSVVADSDEEIERIWKQEHDLKAFIAEDQFKSSADLQKRLDFVLGGGNSVPTAQEQAEREFGDFAGAQDSAPSRPAPNRQESRPTPPRKPVESSPVADDEAAYFESLLNGD